MDLRYYDRLASTNTEAKRLAEEGGAEGLVVVAAEQTAGRGRGANQWYSPVGNAYFSLVLRPALTPERGGVFALFVGLTLCRWLEQRFAVPAQVKWPNDIVCAGKKLGGCLLESKLSDNRFTYLIVGVGLNLNVPPEGATRQGALEATGLAQLTGQIIVPRDFVVEAANVLLASYDTHCRAAFIGFADAVVSGCRTRLWMRNEGVSIASESGGTEGVVRDIAQDGRLVLEQRDGSLMYIASGTLRAL